MGRVMISYEWRLPKVMIALMIVELPLTIAFLTLSGVADPDTYRTKLWQNGYDKGFNSAPNEILYAYANYQPIKVPLIWSSFLTQFNVVCAALSMFILLVKSSMYVLSCFVPLLSVFVHMLLVILYAISIRNQSSRDMSDPTQLSPGLPWYLSKGCSYAEAGNYGYCMMARATFAVAIVMCALFAVYLGMSIWSSIPSKKERQEREAEKESDIEMKKIDDTSPDSELSREEKWERNREVFMNLPKTPNTPGFGQRNPLTPRTIAFTALNGEGPSSQIQASGPSRHLPFRQQYSENAAMP